MPAPKLTPAEIRAALEKRARRPAGRPRAPKRLPRPVSPDGPERAYVGALRAINRDLVAAVREFLAAPLDAARAEQAQAQAAEVRQDAGPLDGMAGLDFGILKIRLGELAEARGEEIAAEYADRLGRWNSAEIGRVLGLSLATEPPAVRRQLERWRRENVRLISSIAADLHADVRRTVREAAERGTRVETLAADLTERYGVSESRAELIARDQTLKGNADLTRVRHEAAGIERYAWSTSRDERVRPMHQELEGRIFSLDAAPVTNERGDRNHPGGDFQCRCVAIPILDPQ